MCIYDTVSVEKEAQLEGVVRVAIRQLRLLGDADVENLLLSKKRDLFVGGMFKIGRRGLGVCPAKVCANPLALADEATRAAVRIAMSS